MKNEKDESLNLADDLLEEMYNTHPSGEFLTDITNNKIENIKLNSLQAEFISCIENNEKLKNLYKDSKLLEDDLSNENKMKKIINKSKENEEEIDLCDSEESEEIDVSEIEIDIYSLIKEYIFISFIFFIFILPITKKYITQHIRLFSNNLYYNIFISFLFFVIIFSVKYIELLFYTRVSN